jgi:DNA-binding response OmpR family regulator
MTSAGAEQVRVLLVEDEPRIADFVARGLRLDGHDVVVVEDGEAGSSLAASEDFGVVVLDLGLPGASGLDTLHAIRAARPTLPVIVLTGWNDPATRRDCLAAGATAFIGKPLVVAELRAAVRELAAR